MRVVSSLLLALTVACALAFTPGLAWAQTTSSVTGILGTVSRCTGAVGSACNDDADNPVDQGGFPHPSGVLVNALNFQDCAENLWYQFQIGIQYPSSSYTLEAWAGTQDCSQLTNRQTSATSVCWPVASFQQALTNPFLLNVRMRDIASGVFTTVHPVTYTPVNTVQSDYSICQDQAQTGASTITLYFFFVDQGSNPVGTVQSYPLNFDMRAGNAQGNVTVGIGDTALIVSIPETSDPDTQGWNIYCDPPQNQEAGAIQTSIAVDAPTNNGTCPAQIPDSATGDSALGDADLDGAIADAGASDDSGTGVVITDDAGGSPCGVSPNEAGIPSPGGCQASTVLVPGGTSTVAGVDEAGDTILEEASTTTVDYEGGVAPTGLMNLAFQYGQPVGSAHLCGQTGGTSTSYNVTGLLDGFYYNIAIAATDAAGNVGPLSNVVCAEPQPISDFWTLYSQAGGGAGGGFCSTDGVGVPAGTSGLGVLMVASMVTMIRRRRRS